jgi:flagellar biosynthesis/type III secretory pathway chaperone
MIASAVAERCGHIEKLSKEKPSLLADLHDKQRQIAETPREAPGKKQETEL